MRTLAGRVTVGSNIPLVTFALKKIAAITLPRTAKWLNFFDPDDLLGYPLKPLSPAYRRAVSRDIAVNASGIAANWNPMSHLKYRSDKDFTEPAAKILEGLI